MDKNELLALADEVAGGTGMDNSLDIRVELAMFKPDDEYTSIRPNAAGTKVVFTKDNGATRTCWARDFTISKAARANTAACLRAIAGTIP